MVKGVIAVGCTDDALRVQTLHHILILGWLNKLLFELVQLTEIFISAHAVVLVDVELVELAGRVGAYHVVRLYLLLLVMVLLLVMLRLRVDSSCCHVRRKVTGILVHINQASAIEIGPLMVRRLVHGDLIAASSSVARGIGLRGLLLALLVLHMVLFVAILYWCLNLNCQ